MKKAIRYAAHLGSLIPLGWLVYDYLMQNLSFNPIQELTIRTGKTALVLLVLSLAVTPVKILTGSNLLLPLRRILGLYAALYAVIHFSIFVGLDYFFDWTLIKQAIVEKPFVMVGFAGFLILAILAITSTKGWKRRLRKKWKPLHRTAYAAGVLVVIHFLWAVKSDIREPLVFGAVLGVLLVLRLPFVRRYVGNVRKSVA